MYKSLMQHTQHQNLIGFIWSIANKLRGPYRPPQYRRVMLPLIVLRRFDLKVKLKALRPEQAAQLLQRHCQQQGLDEPNPSDLTLLQSLNNLTPGDFAAVLRQSRLRPLRSASKTWQPSLRLTHPRNSPPPGASCCTWPFRRKLTQGPTPQVHKHEHSALRSHRRGLPA